MMLGMVGNAVDAFFWVLLLPLRLIVDFQDRRRELPDA